MDTENYFPRGGKIVVDPEKNIKRKHEYTMFLTEHEPKVKKQKKKNQNNDDIESKDLWQNSLNCHGTLTYNKIQDGMIILACVRHISRLAVQVEFPGLTFGLVTINRISDSFTAMLTKKLEEKDIEDSCTLLKNQFKIGQLLPAKIIKIENTAKGHEVYASLDPRDINADKNHNSFKKGALIWASVVSELDHGYELSVGVKNCRIFLPHKHIDEEKKYAVSELTYCVVLRADYSNIATTLTVSVKQEHIDKVQLKEDVNLHDVLPGMKVEFLVEKVVRHGIKGRILENCWAYLDETQIFSKFKLEDLTEGSTLSAYVLYVEPITKITYLTLRDIHNLILPQYELGKIIVAEINSNVPRGVHIKLGKDAHGFVANKRLLSTLPKKAELDIVDAVHKKYPIGSRHSCRILDYNFMQQLYICTFEQKIIKETIFSTKDLKVGQNVDVKIDKIIPNGLVVKAGNVQGFVPNLHLSNIKYSNQIQKKYSVGMTVNAKVLSITPEDNILFTFKQGLVEADKCLAKIEDAVPNTQHVGFVVQTKISGALISFFGDVKGWISNKVLNLGNMGRHVDPRDYFFIGQVVSVWIMGFKNEKLELSLHFPHSIKKKKLRIGGDLSGRIMRVCDRSLDIELLKNKIPATIPMGHLSNYISLCPLLLKTYKVGEKIQHLTCVNNADIPVMSIREYKAFEDENIKFPKFSDLKKEMVLRCSYEKNTDSGIIVSTPITDFDQNIEILTKDIDSSGDSLPTFEKHQLILAKIVEVDHEKKNISLSVIQNCRVTGDVNKEIELLIDYFKDANRIYRFGRQNNWTITKYKRGSRVECKVHKIDMEGKCWVKLPNEVDGIVAPHLCPSNIEVGSTVEGVVLDYNFSDNYVHICCKNDIKQKINPLQDGVVTVSLKSCMAKILLLTKNYALGILNDSRCNRQLVYLPLLFSENDDKKSLFQEGAKLKVVLQKHFVMRMIGVPKRVLLSLEKTKLKTMNKQNKKIRVIKKKSLMKDNNSNEETPEAHDTDSNREDSDSSTEST